VVTAMTKMSGLPLRKRIAGLRNLLMLEQILGKKDQPSGKQGNERLLGLLPVVNKKNWRFNLKNFPNENSFMEYEGF